MIKNYHGKYFILREADEQPVLFSFHAASIMISSVNLKS